MVVKATYDNGLVGVSSGLHCSSPAVLKGSFFDVVRGRVCLLVPESAPRLV